MTKELPPATLDELKALLNNPTFKVYLYIGESGDAGGRIAKLAEQQLQHVRVFIVRDETLIAEYVTDENCRGVVFGFTAEPKRCLSQAETESLRIVLEAISNA